LFCSNAVAQQRADCMALVGLIVLASAL